MVMIMGKVLESVEVRQLSGGVTVLREVVSVDGEA